MKRIDRTGERFGRLVVLRLGTPYFRPDGRLYGIRWICRCDCGKEVEAHTYGLKSGATRSCGCLQRETIQKQGFKNKRHGLTGSRTHTSWTAMLRRCSYKKGNRWHCYGGKGIKVCRRWYKFENFLADMGERPPETSLERKNNNADYCPSNCMWADKFTQANNRANNRKFTFLNKTQTLAQWALALNVGSSVISGRIRRGWSIERALTQMPRIGKYKNQMNHLTETVVEYVPKALRTELNPKKFKGDALVMRRLTHAAMGVVTEIAELAGGLDTIHELEELGDTAFYLALATDVLAKKKMKVKIENAPVHHNKAGDKATNLLHLVRASGDLTDFCKRWIHYSKEPDWNAVQFTVQELWKATFKAVLLRGGDIQTCLDANIHKLKVRYPDKFTTALAVKRDLQQERKVLEKHMANPTNSGNASCEEQAIEADRSIVASVAGA